MRTRQTILALAAAALLLPASAYAKPRSKEDAENKANYKACMAEAGHDPKDCLWHLKFDNCLMTDNRGVNHDGEEFCMQSSAGLSQAQIDDFFKREGEKSAAPFIAEMKPGYKNCWREIDDAKRLGSWTGPPSAEDCIQWAEKLQTKGRAMIDKGLKELMESK
jgi:hypothetical protein